MRVVGAIVKHLRTVVPAIDQVIATSTYNGSGCPWHVCSVLASPRQVTASFQPFYGEIREMGTFPISPPFPREMARREMGNVPISGPMRIWPHAKSRRRLSSLRLKLASTPPACALACWLGVLLQAPLRRCYCSLPNTAKLASGQTRFTICRCAEGCARSPLKYKSHASENPAKVSASSADVDATGAATPAR